MSNQESNPPLDTEASSESNYVQTDESAEGSEAGFKQLQDELDQTKEQLLRTMADFQNFRRRNQEQVAQMRQFATENLVTALLPVLDSFERTVAAAQQGASLEQIQAGVQAVERQLRSVLESQNVKRIEALGLPFDPEVHEAIAMEPSDEHEANTVIQEIEAGYRMAGRVVRPARVKVAADK